MTRNTRLSSRYWSWVKRLGKKKALVALGHTLLRIIYHMLVKKQPYIEIGPDYLDRYKSENHKRKQLQMIRQLEAEGFVITQTA
jgi:hypothetical protein